MYQLSVEQLIGMSYPKYVVLNEANKELAYTRANHVNIYIDAYQILAGLYNDRVTIANAENSIVSGLINLCAHLRGYYRAVFNVESSIYIVYADGKFTGNANLFQGYNKSFLMKRSTYGNITSVIENNINLLELLCKYLPDIYFVQADMEPSALIYWLITTDDKYRNDPNIIFSKDPFTYITASAYPTANTVVFHLIKNYNDERINVIFPHDSLIKYITATRREVNADTMVKLKKIHSSLMSLVLALTGVKSRSIPYIKNLDVACKVLLEMIEQGKLLNTFTGDIYTIYENFPDNIKAKIDVTSFTNRWKAIDPIFQCGIKSKIETPIRSRSWNVDLQDPETVKDINNKFFIKNPIDLNRI